MMIEAVKHFQFLLVRMGSRVGRTGRAGVRSLTRAASEDVGH